MKRLALFLLFVGTSFTAGGCASSSVGRFLLYGFMEDAEMVVRNSTPFTVVVNISGDPKDYLIPPGAKLNIPRLYPQFSNVDARIPVVATVEPRNYAIRDGGTTWHFSHQGQQLGNYGGYTPWTVGKYVYATIELANRDSKAVANELRFQVQQ